ncbi:MAG: DMT family transporter [Ardenticatenaceae bacterium]|nr:DMT family transporter [Ardenticatenaceae bacterium]
MTLNPELLTILFGLSSAITWGAADFSGGLATKRTAATLVVFFSQMVGLGTLLLLAVVFGEAFPAWRDIGFGALAGVFGMCGLLALYHGLGHGQMGIVAPVAALVTSFIPIVVAFVVEGLPQPITVGGIGIALGAVWILSASGEAEQFSRQDVLMGCAAGIGFGLFLTFIDLSSRDAVFWPLVAGRTAALVLLGSLITVQGRWQRPDHGVWGTIFLAGVFDSLGNALFAVATQFGRLDIAAILSSLYPASTIFLARFILHERLARLQWIGVGLALVALVLIAQ